ncbi:MAG: type II toxin-antitoxin system HicB family antitoxin [Chloroflexi bacterium]|nr:type II toxin-antitoxin system HicB family antitoxin [Chloroflexota bacterium]
MKTNPTYLVILEKGNDSYGAYVPDLPGCIAVGETKTETLKLIREAIRFHLEELRDDGVQTPRPRFSSQSVKVPA